MPVVLSIGPIEGCIGLSLAGLGGIGDEGRSLGESLLRFGNESRTLALSSLLQGKEGSLLLLELLDGGAVIGHGPLKVFFTAALPMRERAD